MILTVVAFLLYGTDPLLMSPVLGTIAIIMATGTVHYGIMYGYGVWTDCSLVSLFFMV